MQRRVSWTIHACKDRKHTSINKEKTSSLRVRNVKQPLFATQRNEGFTASSLAQVVNGIYKKAGRRSDFVIGVAVVTAHGINLSAFASQFELARQVDRSNASASYAFYATRAHDYDMGEIWVLKVEKECLNEQSKPT